MKELMLSIFGEYEPITYIDGGVEKVASGFAGVDFVYLGGVMVFCICLYSVFRILGSIFKK